MDLFSDVPVAPIDSIFGVYKFYDACDLPRKYLLSVGLYQTEEGKPYVFPAVSKAESRIIHKYDKNYLPMTGHPGFIEYARKLLWSDEVLDQMGERITSCQSCAGTGGLYITGQLALKHLNVSQIMFSDPAWPNYLAIFSGFKQGKYRYIKDGCIDIEGIEEDLSDAPERSLIVIQACAHNPTGIDPNQQQWQRIIDAVKSRNHIILFDCAYMGFGSGDIDKDVEIIRKSAKDGLNFLVSFSFSKCMGLYGERIGCVHAVCNSKEEANAVQSQFASFGRGVWSVCPQNGALIAWEILKDDELKRQWIEELKAASKRINDIRSVLCDLLEKFTNKD